MTRFDVYGNPIELSVPKTVICAVCSATAERCSSVDRGGGKGHHNYRCRTCRDAGRIDGGTILERGDDISRRIGPVFRNPYNEMDVGQPVSHSGTNTETETEAEADADGHEQRSLIQP